jgi:hypothetical protein
MQTLGPMDDRKAIRLDVGLRTLLSSRKPDREFRSVADQYRNRLVLHSTETELNREFGRRGTAQRNWFFITLTFLAAVDFLWLRIDSGSQF